MAFQNFCWYWPRGLAFSYDHESSVEFWLNHLYMCETVCCSTTMSTFPALLRPVHQVLAVCLLYFPCSVQCVAELPDSDDPAVCEKRMKVIGDKLAVSSCLFHWDEMILCTRQDTGGKPKSIYCLRHGSQTLQEISPDIVRCHWCWLSHDRALLPETESSSQKMPGSFSSLFSNYLVCTMFVGK